MMVVDRLFFDHCFLCLPNQQLAVLFSSFSQERQFNEPLPSNTHHHHHLFFPIVYHQQASISPLRPLPHRRYLNKNKNRRQSRGQVGGEGQKGRTTTFAIRGCCVTHLPIISFSSQNRKREKTGFVQSIAIIDSWTSSVRERKREKQLLSRNIIIIATTKHGRGCRYRPTSKQSLQFLTACCAREQSRSPT